MVRSLRAIAMVTMALAAVLVPQPSRAVETQPDPCSVSSVVQIPWASDCTTLSPKSAAITPTGNFTGTVTDASTGAPVEGISVFLTNAETLEWWRDREIVSSADGTFAMRVPTGDYYALFADQFGGYEAAFWDGATRWDESVPVAVVTNETTVVDRSMEPGGNSIAGTVTDQFGAPVEGISVYAVHDHSEFDHYTLVKGALGLGVTEPDGSFSVNGLPDGEYWVLAGRVVQEAWHGSDTYTGDPVADGATPVSLPGTSTGLDLTVDMSGAVVGYVTDAFTGEDLVGTCSEAIDATDLETVLASGISDERGRFHINGLTGLPMVLRHSGCSHDGYVTAWQGALGFDLRENVAPLTLSYGEILVLIPAFYYLYFDINDSVFRSDIIWITLEGISNGCSTADLYCPADPVTRGQMAALLVRALDLTDIDPTIDFNDDNASIFETDIKKLATAGVTSGCGGNNYCPSQPVTRGQMAAFVVRALGLTDIDPTIDFDDDDLSPFETDIEKLATAGITNGCGDNNYCPSEPVTRGQMAAFLKRALD